ncbi:MAG: hypothetical protein ACK55I_04860, partial [bacterium]
RRGGAGHRRLGGAPLARAAGGRGAGPRRAALPGAAARSGGFGALIFEANGVAGLQRVEPEHAEQPGPEQRARRTGHGDVEGAGGRGAADGGGGGVAGKGREEGRGGVVVDGDGGGGAG